MLSSQKQSSARVALAPAAITALPLNLPHLVLCILLLSGIAIPANLASATITPSSSVGAGLANNGRNAVSTPPRSNGHNANGITSMVNRSPARQISPLSPIRQPSGLSYTQSPVESGQIPHGGPRDPSGSASVNVNGNGASTQHNRGLPRQASQAQSHAGGSARASLRDRSIYQVLTDRFALDHEDEHHMVRCDSDERRYCGGSWRGIERRLGYIQGMGFDTVWISPIVANVEAPPGAHESYHGYWASNIYQLNSHFGTPQDLLSLSAAIHARGMYLMVDVVANHLGTHDRDAQTFQMGITKERYGPFNHPSDFHERKFPTNWDEQQQVEQCWLGPEMPDLNTESPRVISILHNWIATLVPTYSIDFLRIDTVKHVRKSFWPDFIAAAGVPCMGEVLHGDPAYLGPYQKESMDSLLDFANFFHVRRAFQGRNGDVAGLVDMGKRMRGHLKDVSMLGSFVDNHDFERLAGLANDPALVRNAMAFSFVNDGFPIVYQGQEHGLTGGADPMNREAIWLSGYDTESEMYHFFRRLNRARRTALTQFPSFHTHLSTSSLLNPHVMSIRKSPLLSILNNYASRSPPTVIYIPPNQTGYQPLLVVIDIISGAIIGTDQKGGLSVPIVNGEPRVFMPLTVYRSQSVPVETWFREGMRLDMNFKDRENGMGDKDQDGPGPGPRSGHPAKSPSFGRVMSWLGIGSKSP